MPVSFLQFVSYPFRNPFLAFPSVPFPSPTLPRDEAAALALALPAHPTSLSSIRAAPPSSSWQTRGSARLQNCIPLPPLSFYPFLCQHFTSTESAEHCGAPLPIERATPATLSEEERRRQNEITGRVVEGKTFATYLINQEVTGCQNGSVNN